MINNKINEFLFTLYIFLFSLLKVLTVNVQGISTQILLVCVLSILIVSLFYNKMLINIRVLFFMIIMSIFLCIEFLFRGNSETGNYIYNFIIYGGITVYLYSFVKDKNQVLFYYAYFSLILFLLYCWDPFNGYLLTTNYMIFGFNFMLPAFAGLYIGGKYLGIKWMRIFALFALIEIVLFANKGSSFAAFFIIFIFSTFFVNNNGKYRLVKRFFLYGFALTAIYIIWINLLNIINTLINIVEKINLNSYSLTTLKSILIDRTIENRLSEREQIWQNAKDFIEINPLIGSGTAAFHSNFGIYPHNLFLEILTSYGMLGLIIFIILWLKSCKVVLISSSFDKIFCILMLCLWVVPLTFSMNIFESKEFWIFIMIGLIKPISNK
ncbi:O-antigen ligase family protein [Peribacillus frigoritolerans]